MFSLAFYSTMRFMNAYIFDVDGVITDSVEKKITKLELIDILAQKLQQHTHVAFISGRGIQWLQNQVVSVLERYFDEHQKMDKKLLDNLYVSGEFGGVSALHSLGIREEFINPDFGIPDELRTTLNTIGQTFSYFARIEHDKQTQFTMEANSGNDFFGEEGEKIADSLRREIIDYPNLEVHVDRIGMNVKNKDANKRYAIVQYLQWAAKKGFAAEKYYVFGDSASDLEMGEELHHQGKKFEFIFVGNKEDLNNKSFEFAVTITKGHCDAGTLEYLQSQK